MKVNTRDYRGIMIKTDDGIERNFRVDFNTIFYLEQYEVDLKELDDLRLFMIFYCGVKHEIDSSMDIEVFELITKKSFQENKHLILGEYINCMIPKIEKEKKKTRSTKKSIEEKEIDLDYLFYVHDVVLKLKGDFWRKTPAFLFSMIEQHRKFNTPKEESQEQKKVSPDIAF